MVVKAALSALMIGADPVWNLFMPHAREMELSPLNKRQNLRQHNSGIDCMSDIWHPENFLE